jgi:hypothetical protein
MVEDLAEYLGGIYDFHGQPKPPQKELVEVHNRVRNELKHNYSGKKAGSMLTTSSRRRRCSSG